MSFHSFEPWFGGGGGNPWFSTRDWRSLDSPSFSFFLDLLIPQPPPPPLDLLGSLFYLYSVLHLLQKKLMKSPPPPSQGLECRIVHAVLLIQGSHPTWKTLNTCNLVIYFSRSGKCLEFAQKMEKTFNFISKPGKNFIFNSKFSVLRFTFQNIIYKYISFTSLLYLHYQHKHCHSKPNWPGISLFLSGNNPENTWNFVSPEKWEPW